MEKFKDRVKLGISPSATVTTIEAKKEPERKNYILFDPNTNKYLTFGKTGKALYGRSDNVSDALLFDDLERVKIISEYYNMIIIKRSKDE
tara:strand:- start:1385 stop:1654 length:270 start_codon:yes stop_codon:yes gene_type:complete